MGETRRKESDHLWDSQGVTTERDVDDPRDRGRGQRLTSDPQVSVPGSVHSHQVNGLHIVPVHHLQLLPGDWSGLSLQKVQT